MLKSLATVLALLGFRDLYCPSCERFSADEWSVDFRGLCRGCGRAPVIVEAGYRVWYWCENTEAWRDERCSKDRNQRCCSPYTATVLAKITGDAVLGRHPFCPACRVFSNFEVGLDGRDRCVTCGKTPTTADAADVDWYWCRADERWLTRPCPRDRAGSCDQVRPVRMPLAWPVPPPSPATFVLEPGSVLECPPTWTSERWGSTGWRPSGRRSRWAIPPPTAARSSRGPAGPPIAAPAWRSSPSSP